MWLFRGAAASHEVEEAPADESQGGESWPTSCEAVATAEEGADERLIRSPARDTDSATSNDVVGVEQSQLDDAPLEDRELEALYDFPGEDVSSIGSLMWEHCSDSESLEAAAERRVRMVEAKLQERESALQMQMEVQERKLSVASRALRRTRGQVQQLNAQLGLKDLEGSRLSCQVSQLRNLLVEKERRLQELLDARAAATLRPLPAPPVAGPGNEEPQPTQQPQEPPVACVQAAAGEEQLMHLSRVAEELTEALEASRESEDEVRRQLLETETRLQAEQASCTHYQRALEAAERQREAEVSALLQRLSQQQQSHAMESARAQELRERSSRAVIEDRLQQALAHKGKNEWYPHLEV